VIVSEFVAERKGMSMRSSPTFAWKETNLLGTGKKGVALAHQIARELPLYP
jgi:hypothetical protein